MKNKIYNISDQKDSMPCEYIICSEFDERLKIEGENGYIVTSNSITDLEGNLLGSFDKQSGKRKFYKSKNYEGIEGVKFSNLKEFKWKDLKNNILIVEDSNSSEIFKDTIKAKDITRFDGGNELLVHDLERYDIFKYKPSVFNKGKKCKDLYIEVDGRLRKVKDIVYKTVD